MNTPQIILECKQGSTNAFRQLVEGYSDLAFSVAFRIVNDEEEAKDIVQDSFIAIWKNLSRLDESKSFKSWLSKTVVNKCLDHLRKKKRSGATPMDENKIDELLISGPKDPEQILSNAELGQLISRLTERLTPKQKVVFVLHELEGFTHDEIVDATEMTKDSIKSNLNHARRNIGKWIKEQY